MTKTTTNLHTSNFNTLANTIDYAFTQKMFDINTFMVCKFIQYITIGNTKYGQVQQLINNIDVEGKPLQSPMQFNVPISYTMGGVAGINITYQENDLVGVIYSQQGLVDLKIAWDNGNYTINNIQPSSYGKFTLENGIIISKISPIIPTVIIDINNNGITINSNNNPVIINSGNADININSNNANITSITKIKLKAPIIQLDGAVETTSTIEAQQSVSAPIISGGTTTIDNTGITATPDLNINGSPFKGHIHSGVTTGSGNSGGVV